MYSAIFSSVFVAKINLEYSLKDAQSTFPFEEQYNPSQKKSITFLQGVTREVIQPAVIAGRVTSGDLH